MVDTLKEHLRKAGTIGGRAGTGKAKRRSREQYQAMAAKSAQVRKAKKERT